MRRFSRRRRGGAGGGGSSPIDAAHWLERLREAGVVAARTLEPLQHDEVADHYAAVGRGEKEDGSAVVVCFSPRHGGDALLAALVTGARLAEEESYAGEVVAVAPEWSIAARRRLGLVRDELPFVLTTLAAPSLGETRGAVEPETALEPSVVPIEQTAAHLTDLAARDLFLRAASALDGLASKHGGRLRGVPGGAELVIMARRVAELRADDGGVALTTLEPQRSTARLSLDGLAGALDGLEGQLRRRLNDRRVRDGEDGLRTRLLPLLARARSLRQIIHWPLGAGDREEIDLFGIDEAGHPVAAAARQHLGLEALGGVLDAVQRLRLSLPTLLAGATPPARLELPRLLLAAEEFGPGALRALSTIALGHDLFEIRPDRGDAFALASVGAEEATRSRAERAGRGRRRGRGAGRGREGAPADEAESEAAETAPAAEAAEETGEGRDRKRGRRRGRRRGRGRGEVDEDSAAEAAEEGEAAEEREERGEREPAPFEEMSLLDFDDAGEAEPAEEKGAARRRGRGRQGRRGGRRAGRGAGDAGDSTESEAPLEEESERPSGRARGKAGGGGKSEKADEDEDEFVEDIDESLADLPDDLEVIDEAARARYQDDEEGGPDDEDAALERAKRRMARKAAVEEVLEPPKPRRRAVVVANSDRDSLLAAVLLARDIRLLEGLWIYPQSDLMSFFREVTPDIKEDVPIYLVGFVPSPAVDVLQAVGLVRDRVTWFDHHDWPPEDDYALRQTIGEESVHHRPGTGSSLPVVLETCTRRSRFSDKLVDLATGRFTQHDYERWGRLWWTRLGEIAARSGDVRSEIEPLLAGRPSDLAKEAARVEAPPIPDEVGYVSSRDFRLVHFAGYSMVVVEVAGEHDLHLTGRIARERYSALLSLTHREGEELFLLAGEELSGRHVLDFGALADHLANKLDWIDPLADDDHVARFRVRGLAEHPDRLDAVIGEIAMGRSILER